MLCAMGQKDLYLDMRTWRVPSSGKDSSRLEEREQMTTAIRLTLRFICRIRLMGLDRVGFTVPIAPRFGDPRWTSLIEEHRGASVFHTVSWLQALRRTYGYQPIVFTTSSPDSPLADGVVLCRINSWLTGRRLVSVPFADHCDVFVGTSRERQELIATLEETVRAEQLKYVEFRCRDSGSWPDHGLAAHKQFCFHMLDLGPSLETLFGTLHKDSLQRKIRRASREGIRHEEGGIRLVEPFYRLLIMTRRRHKVPPQPHEWFHNLAKGFGERFKIRLAWKGRQPIAAILARHRDTLYYKYSCSDHAYHNVGAIPLLIWNAVEDAKRDGPDDTRSQAFRSGQFWTDYVQRALALPFGADVFAPSAQNSRPGVSRVGRLARNLIPLFQTCFSLVRAGSCTDT
jgi:hypothetical protein